MGKVSTHVSLRGPRRLTWSDTFFFFLQIHQNPFLQSISHIFHYILQFTYLPSPVKAFDTRECVEMNNEEFKSPLRYFEPYSTEECFQECLILYVNQTCGCIGPYFAMGSGKYPSFKLPASMVKTYTEPK